jgi:hypothetical protein
LLPAAPQVNGGRKTRQERARPPTFTMLIEVLAVNRRVAGGGGTEGLRARARQPACSVSLSRARLCLRVHACRPHITDACVHRHPRRWRVHRNVAASVDLLLAAQREAGGREPDGEVSHDLPGTETRTYDTAGRMLVELH